MPHVKVHQQSAITESYDEKNTLYPCNELSICISMNLFLMVIYICGLMTPQQEPHINSTYFTALFLKEHASTTTCNIGTSYNQQYSTLSVFLMAAICIPIITTTINTSCIMKSPHSTVFSKVYGFLMHYVSLDHLSLHYIVPRCKRIFTLFVSYRNATACTFPKAHAHISLNPLLFLFITINITATMVSGIEPRETYRSSYYFNNGSYFANQHINCYGDSDFCHLICDREEGCYNLSINAASSQQLYIECERNHSCSKLSVIAPSHTLTVHCSAFNACSETEIHAQHTANIELECINSAHSCNQISLFANDVDSVSINCMSSTSCESAVFDLRNTSNAMIVCNGDESCTNVDLECDIDTPCTMQCIANNSCIDLDIYINDAVEHQLNLICNNGTGCNGIMHCDFDKYTKTRVRETDGFLQDINTGDLICTDYRGHLGCCPFKSNKIICETDSLCEIDCINKTCNGYHIDATNAKSLSLICSRCRESIVECPSANSSVCNIVCIDNGTTTYDGGSCYRIFVKAKAEAKDLVLDAFTVKCKGSYSCGNMSLLLQTNVNALDIICGADHGNDTYTCSGAGIYYDKGNFNTFSILCQGQHSVCLDFDIYVDSNDTLAVFGLQCIGYRSCHNLDAFFYGILSVFWLQCIGDFTCYYLKVETYFHFIDKFYMQCGGEDLNSSINIKACYNSDILHYSKTINTLDIVCIGEDQCYYLYLYGVFIKSFNWKCFGEQVCRNSKFDIESSIDVINVTCGGYESCYQQTMNFLSNSNIPSDVYIINQIDFYCFGFAACENYELYVKKFSGNIIKNVTVYCAGERTCYYFEMRVGLNFEMKVQQVINPIIYDINFFCIFGYDACHYITIWADSLINRTNINCMEPNVCPYLRQYLRFNPNDSYRNEFSIYCNGSRSCRRGYFTMPTQNNLIAVDFNITCNGTSSCQEYDFTFGESNVNTNIQCIGANACRDISLQCPIWREGACSLLCSEHNGSCSNVEVIASVNYTYNYLELLCPSKAEYPKSNACDGLHFECVPAIKNTTLWIYDDSNEAYKCSDNSDEYCCPLNGNTWNPTKNPTKHPTEIPTMEPTEVIEQLLTMESTLQSFIYTLFITLKKDIEENEVNHIVDIIQETVNYVVNDTDIGDECVLNEDALSVVVTDLETNIFGEILICTEEEPQPILIVNFENELKAEVIVNINEGTDLIVTADDIDLYADIINPIRFQSSAVYSTEQFDDNVDQVSDRMETTTYIWIGSCCGGFIFLIAVVVCIYRKKKNVSRKKEAEMMALASLSSGDEEKVNKIHGDNICDVGGGVLVTPDDLKHDDNPVERTIEGNAEAEVVRGVDAQGEVEDSSHSNNSLYEAVEATEHVKETKGKNTSSGTTATVDTIQ